MNGQSMLGPMLAAPAAAIVERSPWQVTLIDLPGL